LDHRLSRSGRATAVFALLLHLLVGAFSPLLDGTLEAMAAEPPAHIEARDVKSCVPIHDHQSCQICRVVGREILALDPVAPELPFGPAVWVAAGTAAPWTPTVSIDLALGPRAPPLAS
jgi:hypothetical protein